MSSKKFGGRENILPLTLSVTVTLNWYCCPACSPDTTLERVVLDTSSDMVTPPTVVR